MSNGPGRTPTAHAGHRTDIQAMRALAVGLVLVYHLWPAHLPGGFVGVDVFFVISGYLITGNIVREVRATSRVRLVHFWARRAKRLLPSALTVLAGVVVATAIWVPRSLWAQFSRQVVGSTLYVQNWLLAADSVDYQASDDLASPVQHYWTLSVEEQFYIVLPVVFAVVVLLRRRSRAEWPMVATLLVVTMASLAWSVWFTSVDRASSYFVTTTRAWEFGVGALLAWVPMVRHRSIGTVLFVGGAAAAGAASLVIDARWAFPGLAAAWPVLAAVAMLLGGGALAAPVRRLVDLRPVQYLGDVSYAMYLWHWPLIVLLPFATGHPLTVAEKLAIASVTVVVAGLVTTFVEQPVRSSPRLLGGDRSPTAVLGWCGAAMALVVVGSVTGLRVDVPTAADDAAVLSQLEAAEPDGTDCTGAPAGLDDTTCSAVITTVVPDPLRAESDGYNRPECWSRVDEADFRLCTLGPSTATLRVLVVGDSHSNMYLAAYERIADQRGWSIDVAGHNGCYWTDAVQARAVAAHTTACEAWKDALEQHLATNDRYDAIVVTNARRGDLPLPEGDTDAPTVAADGLVAAWQRQIERGSVVVAVRDVPTLRADVVACVATHLTAANTECAVPLDEALAGREPLLEAADRAGVAVVDLTDVFCDASMCVPVIGNVLAYRDPDHLTGTFAATLDTILGDRLAAALGLG